MNRYIVEFIGTFFLMFTIGVVVLDQSIGNFAPLAIGLVLTAMVFAGGHISGAHYNPAVTISFWLRGNFRSADIFPYIFAQMTGASFAALLAFYLVGNGPAELLEIKTLQALVSETIFTFALVFVILNVATSGGTSGNSYYGLAIGFIVAAGVFCVGKISGAVFNPAVAVGITTIGFSKISNMWIYFLANISGGVLATVVFKSVDKCND